MILSHGWACAVACGLLLAASSGAAAVDIAPHRAIYSMALGTAKQNSGVVAARGSMVFEWGETCDGWTVEQRYKLRMHYAEDTEVEIRQVFETPDFAASDPSGKLMKKEEELRKKIDAQRR